VPACLRDKSPIEIRDALSKIYQLCDPFPLPGKAWWGPIIDDTNLEGQPAALLASGKVTNKVPLIIGSSKDDAILWFQGPAKIDEAARAAAIQKCFSDPSIADAVLKLYPISDYPVPAGSKATASAYALKDSMGDQFFSCPSRRTARHAAAAGMPVYLYYFTLPVSACNNTTFPCPPNTPEPYLGTSWLCFHVFTFHMPQPDPVPDGAWMWDFSQEEEALSQTAMGYWARFAKTGDPNDPSGGAVKWPKYDETTDQYLELSHPPQVKSGLRKAKCALWDALHAP
jgi:carboxylesterase type B